MFFGIGQGIGTVTGFQQQLAKSIVHGLAGGIMQAAQGGKFGHGFLSAGITQFSSERIGKLDVAGAGGRTSRIIASALIGGSVSRLTGGKFAHGAITGAFSRTFNDEMHPEEQEQANPHASDADIALGFASEAVVGFGEGVYRGVTLGFGEVDDLRFVLGFQQGPPVFDESLSRGSQRIGSILGGFTLGGAVGLLGKGAKGFEYSHFIPTRYLKALGLNTFFGRTALNGTYVPRWFHALTDKWRFRFMPRAWKEALPFRVPQGVQQVLRTPPAVAGAGVGGAIDGRR